MPEIMSLHAFTARARRSFDYMSAQCAHVLICEVRSLNTSNNEIS